MFRKEATTFHKREVTNDQKGRQISSAKGRQILSAKGSKYFQVRVISLRGLLKYTVSLGENLQFFMF